MAVAAVKRQRQSRASCLTGISKIYRGKERFLPMDKTGRLLERFHIDAPLLSGAILLCFVGLAVLYSAGGQELGIVIRQGVRIALGMGLMLVFAQVPPQYLLRWVPWLYAGGMILLVAVALFGTGRGAQRWLDVGLIRFQPSEFMKIIIPMTAAWHLDNKPLPPAFQDILIILLIIVAPVILIAKQPDLGTAILIAGAGMAVLFFAGIGWKYLGFTALGAAIGAPLLWSGMHDYQRQRLLTLLDPEQDPLGAGYHIIQSRIAVGSGGLFGKGWLNGTQSHLEFLPESSTDFIFAVFCEEFGFVGVLLLLAAYLFLIIRGFLIALEAQGIFPRLLAASLTFTLFIYVFINMGMVIGQLPVVGVPLPLISYGGTSLVTIMASFGILMAVHTHKKLFL
jgi:rod shape determining protein RodA